MRVAGEKEGAFGFDENRSESMSNKDRPGLDRDTASADLTIRMQRSVELTKPILSHLSKLSYSTIRSKVPYEPMQSSN